MHTGLTDHQARILQHHQTRCPPVPRISSTPGASGGPPARTLRRECDGLANPATKGPGACTRSPEGKTSTGHRQKYYDNVALSDIRSHEMRDLYGSRLPGRSLVKYDKTSLGQVSISLLFELGLFFCDRLVALLTLTFGYQDIKISAFISELPPKKTLLTQIRRSILPAGEHLHRILLIVSSISDKTSFNPTSFDCFGTHSPFTCL